MLTLPGLPGDLVISCNYYDSAGSPVVDLFDNPVLGWRVDEADGPASPVTVGTLPPKSTGATSPQWAHAMADGVFVPDVWRGSIMEFFTWLALDGERKVRGNFRDTRLKYALTTWAMQNPTLFNSASF
jgi:hypothetical protein